jgi:hypothetical protein
LALGEKESMLLKNAIIHFVTLGLFILSGIMGIFAAMGLCAAIWGSQVLNTTLGNPPDKTHPAFWIFMLLAIPGMIVGFVGGTFAFIIPIYTYFNIRVFNTGPNDKRIFTFYIGLLHRFYSLNWPDTEQKNDT